MKRYVAAVITAIALSAFPVERLVAQSFPSRTVTIVVPFAAGGENDLIARAVGNRLATTLGTSVVVENRPGASGNVGAQSVIRAAPDGHTVMIAPVGVFAINRWLFKGLAYDPERDLIPITQAASVPNVLLVQASSPIDSLPGLIAQAKSSPGLMNYASMGVATSGHISGELFNALAKTVITHVPYRGSSPALTDLLGGRVQLMFGNLPTALPLIEAGQLRGIAQTGRERHPQLASTPTLIEQGFENFDIVTWFGFAVPKGTPESIVELLHREITAALRHDEVAEKLRAVGLQVIANSRSEFAGVIANENAKWKRIIEVTGIKMD